MTRIARFGLVRNAIFGLKRMKVKSVVVVNVILNYLPLHGYSAIMRLAFIGVSRATKKFKSFCHARTIRLSLDCWALINSYMQHSRWMGRMPYGL